MCIAFRSYLLYQNKLDSSGKFSRPLCGSSLPQMLTWWPSTRKCIKYTYFFKKTKITLIETIANNTLEIMSLINYLNNNSHSNM